MKKTLLCLLAALSFASGVFAADGTDIVAKYQQAASFACAIGDPIVSYSELAEMLNAQLQRRFGAMEREELRHYLQKKYGGIVNVAFMDFYKKEERNADGDTIFLAMRTGKKEVACFTVFFDDEGKISGFAPEPLPAGTQRERLILTSYLLNAAAIDHKQRQAETFTNYFLTAAEYNANSFRNFSSKARKQINPEMFMEENSAVRQRLGVMTSVNLKRYHQDSAGELLTYEMQNESQETLPPVRFNYYFQDKQISEFNIVYFDGAAWQQIFCLGQYEPD